MMKVRIALETMSDVSEFVVIATKVPEPVNLIHQADEVD